MAFVNEKLTKEQREEFSGRGIKRPWREYIAKPLYRTIDRERNMCLWNLGNLDRDFFDHYMFLFEWNGEEHFIIMEYKYMPSEKHITWSVSEFEKNIIYNQPFADDFRNALEGYAVDGRPDQNVESSIEIRLEKNK